MKFPGDYVEQVTQEISEENFEILENKLKISQKELSNKQKVYDIISSIIPESLKSLHQSFFQKVEGTSAINFDFKIKKIVADNFEGIHHLELDFTNLGKVIFIQGLNGAGKTSIMDAITVALFGDNRIGFNYGRIGFENDVLLELYLEFEGSEYYICRASTYCNFQKLNNETHDWEDLGGRHKRDTEDNIYQTLPFLYYLRSFFVFYKENFFENLDKENFFKRIFGLDIVEQFENVALEKYTELNNSYGKKTEQISDIESRKSAYDKIISQKKEEILKSIESWWKLEYGEKLGTGDESDKLQVEQKKIIKARKESKEIKLKVKEYKTTIRTLEDTLEDITLSEEDVSEKLHSLYSQKEEKEKLETEINEVKTRYNFLSNKKLHSMECPHCKQEIIQSQEGKLWEPSVLQSHKEEIKNRYNDLNSKLEVIPADLNSQIRTLESEKLKFGRNKQTQEKIELVKKELEEIKAKDTLDRETYDSYGEVLENMKLYINEIKGLVSLQDQLQELIEQKETLENDLKELEVLINDLNLYLSYFDINNEKSIPFRVIDKLSKSISSEQLKFTSYKVLGNGNKKFQISCEFRRNGTWVPYHKLSQGEHVRVDIWIFQKLSCLINGIGIVILDELLGPIDEKKYEKISNNIRKIQARNIIISSQSSLFKDYDSCLKLKNNSKEGVHLVLGGGADVS